MRFAESDLAIVARFIDERLKVFLFAPNTYYALVAQAIRESCGHKLWDSFSYRVGETVIRYHDSKWFLPALPDATLAFDTIPESFRLFLLDYLMKTNEEIVDASA